MFAGPAPMYVSSLAPSLIDSMNLPGPIRMVSPFTAAAAAPLIVDCEELPPAGQLGSFTHQVVAPAAAGATSDADPTTIRPDTTRFRTVRS